MSPTLWVRSKWNEQARDEEKLEVADCNSSLYRTVKSIGHEGLSGFLPKEHYVPCAAPEQWERVEIELGKVCEELPACDEQSFFHLGGDRIGWVRFLDHGYRVVSLVVERRKVT